MIELNLQTKSPEQEAIKSYLQENASETLTCKINKGVRTDVNGKPLINRKDLDGFMEYACEEAKKQSNKDARCACINSDTVFGWAVHYFEEDSIIGTLYNEDGTEYKPVVKPTERKYTPTTPMPIVPQKQTGQISLFEMMNDKQEEKQEAEVSDSEELLDESTTEEKNLDEISEDLEDKEDYDIDMETGELLPRISNVNAVAQNDNSVEAIIQALFGASLLVRCV
ncbi:MAG: hypothetical protein EOM87_07910 [Clostridia bacterium]|nr:hypothetical protein [Clostridia bacterium]